MALMSNNLPPIKVQAVPEFQRRLGKLAKRYRHIRDDIQPIFEQLQAGELIGDQIPGTGYTVFKVRVRNSDIQKGKSAGYRVIYQVESSAVILLLLIYSKSDQSDVTVEEIRAAIAANTPSVESTDNGSIDD